MQAPPKPSMVWKVLESSSTLVERHLIERFLHLRQRCKLKFVKSRIEELRILSRSLEPASELCQQWTEEVSAQGCVSPAVLRRPCVSPVSVLTFYTKVALASDTCSETHQPPS